MNKYFISVMMLFFVISTNASDTIDSSKVLSVTDFSYTLNDKQAVSILFGESESNYCNITILRSNVKINYSTNSIMNSDKNVSSTCQWNGKYFVISSKTESNASINIASIDKKNGKSQLVISGLYVSPVDGATFTLPETKLVVEGIFFKNLVKKI